MTTLKHHLQLFLWMILILIAALLFIGASMPQMFLPLHGVEVYLKRGMDMPPVEKYAEPAHRVETIDSILAGYRKLSTSA